MQLLMLLLSPVELMLLPGLCLSLSVFGSRALLDEGGGTPRFGDGRYGPRIFEALLARPLRERRKRERDPSRERERGEGGRPKRERKLIKELLLIDDSRGRNFTIVYPYVTADRITCVFRKKCENLRKL